MKKLLTLLLTILLISNTNAETIILRGKAAADKIANAEVVRLKDHTAIPNFVKFKKGKELSFDKLESWLAQFSKSENAINLKLLKVEEDKLGFTHFRYQQLINGVPTTLGNYIVHVKNGLIVSLNGNLFSDINVNTSTGITESTALNKALINIGASLYKWQIPSEEAQLKEEQNNPNATYYPKGELVWINKKGNVLNSLVLAYQFNIYAQKPFSRREIYIDASTGENIWEEDQIHEADVTGTASTLYSGTQTIVCDNSVGPFRLQEAGRGNGIKTYSNGNTTNYSTADITNGSATWSTPDAALDAHWGAEMTYDYFLNVHGRNSIDGNGFTLISHVHHDQNYSNAFWDGSRMTYGDGSGNNAPFTALDIAGHEISHGLTSNTAGLIYNAESGALNESFSDIFGVSIEYVARPTQANWQLGEDLGFIIRDMKDPNSQGDPDTYFGTNWASLSGGDNGGVHTNSGVQNFWYVLLTDGGTGTNDNGDAYTVNGLGLTDASKVAFRNLTIYLTSSSGYADARFYAIQSAVDLFGGCTSQVKAVTNAWYAVGVGNIYSPVTVSDFSAPIVSSCSVPFTVDFSNNSVNGASFSWNFGDGNLSTQVNPSNTYTSYGTYAVELFADGGATCGTDTETKTAFITIDANLPCVTILPTNGVVSTQTSCNGKIFDSGGAASGYGTSEDVQITIAPTGASTVDLNFLSFAIEAGTNGSCEYDYLDVFDGPNTSSTLIGKYCNNNIPTTISSTGGSITIVFHSDGGVEDTGFEIDWNCNMSGVSPSADFVADVDTTCNGIINFSDISTNGPTSWSWNFGDGNTSNQQNPTNIYQTNGLYTVQLTATNNFGNDVVSKTNYIFVDAPLAPQVTGNVTCENTSASLVATASGDIDWYNASTGGTPFNTGSTFTTPILTADVTYYLQSVVTNPLQIMGKPDNTGGGGNFTNQQHLFFDVDKSMIIDSVDIYSGANGLRTIELRDASGTVLQSTSVSVPSGQQTVYLGFTVNPGTDYQLGLSGGSPIDMYRNNANVNYPYTLSGIGAVTHSSANQNGGLDHYYFFYNWKVREANCMSERAPITVTVNVCTGIDENTKLAIKIYPNPANNVLTIENALLNDTENNTIKILDMLGKVVLTEKINSSKQTLNITSLNKGIYFIVLDDGARSFKFVKQ